MTTILFTFIAACVLALVLTPLAARLGARLGAMDAPSARKVHTREIPRSGGLAIALSFVLALAAAKLLATQISALLVWEPRTLFAVLGAAVAFGTGLWDDFRRLGPRIKLLAQILAASLAFYGGLQIKTFVAGDVGVDFGLLSWAVTVFWFLLFINAVNLIDGLDGLAAGVAFFTSAVMVVLAILQGNLLTAVLFAALGGTLLGFLRYNFNPASIFMGDGGSYFIGYAIAAISILGQTKAQVGATLLIPLLALGVPIFDTLLSPLRRWVKGQRMFQPDKEHIHHRLLKLGFSSRRVVLLLYGVSFLLCVLAILLVNYRDEVVGLLLIVLGAGAVLFVRKLGYLEYFATDKLLGWLKDVSDVTGLTRDRRSFLNLQLELERAENLEDLWMKLCLALELLRFDRAELHLDGWRPGGGAATATAPPAGGIGGGPGDGPGAVAAGEPRGTEQAAEIQAGGAAGTVVATGTGQIPEAPASGAAGAATGDGPSPDGAGAGAGSLGGIPGMTATAGAGTAQAPAPAAGGRAERRSGAPRRKGGSAVWTREEKNGRGTVRVWARGHHRRREDGLDEGQLRIAFPLPDSPHGKTRLTLFKNLDWEPLQPFTLRRVEHLRRSLFHAFRHLK